MLRLFSALVFVLRHSTANLDPRGFSAFQYGWGTAAGELMYTGFKIEVFEHQLNHNLFKFEKRFHIEKKGKEEG